MREAMKRSSQLSVLRTVLFKYVLGSPVVRVVVVPIMAVLVVVGYGEIFITQILNDIQEKARDTDAVNERIRMYLAVALSSYVFGMLSLFAMSSYIERVCRDYIVDLYRDHVGMSFLDFKRIGVGNMISFMNRKIQSLEDMLESVTKCFIMSICCVAMTMVKIWSGLGSKYGALISGVVVVYGVCVVVINHYRNTIRLKMNREIDLSRRRIYNNILNYDIIKSYNNEELEARELYRSMKAQTKFGKMYWSWLQVGNFIGENIFVMAMFAITVQFSRRGEAGFKDYTLLLSLSNQLRMYCVDISNSFGVILLNLTNVAQNRCEPSRLDVQSPGLYKADFVSEMRIEGLEVSVGDKQLIRGMSMSIRRGEKIVVSGDNGSGKTSFARTLLGFFDYSGSVLVDGVELRTLSKEGLRRMVSYSPQESQLFSESVLSNIRDGNLDMSDEEIVRCCKRYGMHEVFAGLEDGYQTSVGVGGRRLSGGQRQKVSMMRAVVKDAPIYIFDQVTSHVDKESERRMVEMILEHLADRTVIMIMQNAELFDRFDKVYYLSSGMLSG